MHSAQIALFSAVSHLTLSSLDALPGFSVCSRFNFYLMLFFSCLVISYCSGLLAVSLICQPHSHHRVFDFALFFAWNTVSKESHRPPCATYFSIQFKYDLFGKTTLTTLYTIISVHACVCAHVHTHTHIYFCLIYL